MNTLATALVALVALLHLYFLVLEMFLWTGRQGRRLHGFKPEMAKATAPLAANQGLYNGFLAAGLLWGLYLGSTGSHIVVFFLICVVVAGVYGAWSVSKRIFFVQALPAALALALVLLSSP